jgi:DNA-binding transcriptional LysR family regulator
MLSPQRLEFLRAVAQRGTIAAAADATGYSPSAVSQQLATLEREAGLELLERNARSVRLTEAGRVLAERAAAALGALRDAHAAARAAAGLGGGRLRIGTFPSAGARLVPAALAQFAADHPGVALELRDLEPEHADHAVLDDRVDVVITHEHELLPIPAAPGIRRDEIAREPLVLAVAAKHPLSRRARADLAACSSEPWIADPDASGRHAITEAACAAAGFAPDVAFRTADTLVAAGLVRAGLGVALLPRQAATAIAGPGLTTVELTTPVWRITQLTTRTGSTHPGVAPLLAALRAAA